MVFIEMFGSQSLNVDVVYHHHANLDSFPFRYGIHYKETTSLKLFNCKDYKWQKNGEKFEVEASFIGQEGRVENGLFILAITDFPNPRVVTVMRNDVETEFFLSKLLRSLRESGKVSTSDFLEWHPLYISGEANTFEKLAKLYASKSNENNLPDDNELVSKSLAEARAEYDELLKEKENEIYRLKLENEKIEATAKEAFEIYEHTEKELKEKSDALSKMNKENVRIREIAEVAIDGLNERDSMIQNQKDEIEDKNHQISQFKEKLLVLAKQHPQYDGSPVELSTVGRLEKVEKRKRQKSNGDIVNCVFLHFKDGLPERKMDEVFDPQDLIFEKAKEYIGKEVVTITWKPEIFRATHWFRDIYLWDKDIPTENSEKNLISASKTDVEVYLNCPFEQKDECKSLGGKWDPQVKKWYVPKGLDVSQFSRWFSEKSNTEADSTHQDYIPF